MLWQLVLAGVGVLQTVPLFCTLVVERGFLNSMWEVLQVRRQPHKTLYT